MLDQNGELWRWFEQLPCVVERMNGAIAPRDASLGREIDLGPFHREEDERILSSRGEEGSPPLDCRSGVSRCPGLWNRFAPGPNSGRTIRIRTPEPRGNRPAKSPLR
jgi:hypothetical protein